MPLAASDQLRVGLRVEEGDGDGFEERGDRFIADAIEENGKRHDQSIIENFKNASKELYGVSQIQRPDPTLPLYTKVLLIAEISQSSCTT